MSVILKQIVGAVKKEIPSINKPLITELRQQMIASIETIIDNFMRSALASQIDEIEYLNYEEVNPSRLAEYRNNKDNYYPLDVKDSTLKLIEYKFQIREKDKVIPFSLYYCLPFLYEEALELKGTKYFPVFNITNRFIIRIRGDAKAANYHYEGVFISTMLFPLKIYLRPKDKLVIESTNKTRFAATVMKIYAHHNLKDGKLPPALIYPLARYGLKDTLVSYGFEPEELTFVSGVDGTDIIYEYFEINKFLYLKVKKESLTFTYKRRFIVTLVSLIKFSPVSLDELLNNDINYFQWNLGKWIQGSDAGIAQQMNQSGEHLKTMNRMVDHMCINNLALDGIMVKDVYELIHHMFFHIDKVIYYQSNNLFNKRIALLPQLLFTFISRMNTQVFSRSKISNGDIKKKDIGSIFSKDTRLLIKGIEQMTEVFTSESNLSNGNWLLSVGARKYKSKKINNPSAKHGKKRAKGGAVKGDAYIFAHASQLFVESILNLPASNPCFGGTLNIFYKDIDMETGILNPPEDYYQHEDIFKDME